MRRFDNARGERRQQSGGPNYVLYFTRSISRTLFFLIVLISPLLVFARISYRESPRDIGTELLSKVGDAGFRRRVRLAFLRP